MNNFYFEKSSDNHSKFWAITLSREKGIFILTRKWGKIGQNGRIMIEEYPGIHTADDRRQKLIEAKIAKGYKAVM